MSRSIADFIKQIFRLLGYLFVFAGWLTAFSMGLYGLFEAFDIVSYLFGKVVAILSLAIFPVPLGLAPWYVGFTHGDWTLLLITYGALPVLWISLGIAGVFFKLSDGDKD